MENKYRNELEVKIGGETILLRPTFENIAAMEENIGGLSYLAWKYSRATGKDGQAKALPGLTECAKIIYFNQAATKPDDPTQKKLSLEEVWDLVSKEGVAVITPVLTFLGRITAGQKEDSEPKELSESEKKS